MFRRCKEIKAKQYQLRKGDRYLYVNKQYYSISAVMRMRTSNKERSKARYALRKKDLNKERVERARKAGDAHRERVAKWHATNRVRNNAREIARKYRRIPTRWLGRAISQYGRGLITFDELDRLCLEALTQADALALKACGNK